MTQKATINIQEFAAALGMEVAVQGRGYFEVDVSDVYRPSLPCAGYFSHIVPTRMQLFGNAEMYYLSELPADVERVRMERYFSFDLPVVCISAGHEPTATMRALAQEKGVPVVCSKQSSTRLTHLMMGYVDVLVSPCITRHGGLVDIYGVGVMLMGESGIGKSETALELVKRGHRLVADDVIEIRRIGDAVLKGCAPELVRYLMEVRGIGIIDVRSLYGVGAVINDKNIDLCIELQDWDDQKEYDRIGMSNDTLEILGVEVPRIVLPVRPGRNLAIIVEVAAMNFRLKRMGIDAAVEFDERLKKKFAEGKS